MQKWIRYLMPATHGMRRGHIAELACSHWLREYCYEQQQRNSVGMESQILSF